MRSCGTSLSSSDEDQAVLNVQSARDRGVAQVQLEQREAKRLAFEVALPKNLRLPKNSVFPGQRLCQGIFPSQSHQEAVWIWAVYHMSLQPEGSTSLYSTELTVHNNSMIAGGVTVARSCELLLTTPCLGHGRSCTAGS